MKTSSRSVALLSIIHIYLQAGKTKWCGDLLPWIPPMKNHLWDTARQCECDSEKLKVGPTCNSSLQ